MGDNNKKTTKKSGNPQASQASDLFNLKNALVNAEMKLSSKREENTKLQPRWAGNL